MRKCTRATLAALLILSAVSIGRAQCPDGRGRTLVLAFGEHPFLPGDTLMAMRGHQCLGIAVVAQAGAFAIPVRHNDLSDEVGETEWLLPRDKFRLDLWRGGVRYRIFVRFGGKRYWLFAFNPSQEVITMRGVQIR